MKLTAALIASALLCFAWSIIHPQEDLIKNGRNGSSEWSRPIRFQEEDQDFALPIEPAAHFSGLV